MEDVSNKVPFFNANIDSGLMYLDTLERAESLLFSNQLVHIFTIKWVRKEMVMPPDCRRRKKAEHSLESFEKAVSEILPTAIDHKSGQDIACEAMEAEAEPSIDTASWKAKEVLSPLN